MNSTASIPTFNQAKAETFAANLLTAINQGSLCLMISIGHRTGLFDVMSSLPPSTSEEIASQASLNERYVREWLGAMVTANIVEVDLSGSRFSLPPEYAASLTRAAAADNMAVFAQYIAIMGAVENEIVECFHKGGGVPYEKFGRFHAVMAEDSGQSVLSSLESHILPLVPGLADRLTQGIAVLDVGCGSGRILNRLAACIPRSEFTGLDLSSEAIQAARKEALHRKHQNTQFYIRDLSDFNETAETEAYEFDHYVRCRPRPGETAQRAQRHFSRVETGWGLPDAGYPRLKLRSKEHRSSAGHISLRHFHHALHDRVPGARRRRFGRDVG